MGKKGVKELILKNFFVEKILKGIIVKSRKKLQFFFFNKI